MNKKWKVFWIVSASIAVLGVVTGMIGVGLGGTWQAIKNRYPHGIGFVDGELIKPVENATGRNHKDKEHHGTGNGIGSGNMTFAVDEINSIDIDVTCGELGIYYYDGTEIEVGYEGLPVSLDFECYKGKEKELVIETNEKVKVGAACGEIWIRIPRDKEFFDVSVDVGVGEVKAYDLKTKALDIDCGAGEVTVSGSVDGDISIDCGAGQVNCILTSLSRDSYNYEVEVGAGEVSIGRTSVAGVNVHRTYDNRASRNMEIDCGMGEVNVEFEN